MCFSTPKIPNVAPLQPPPPPEPTATEVGQPLQRRKRAGVPSELDSLRIPLNPTGVQQQPRIGL